MSEEALLQDLKAEVLKQANITIVNPVVCHVLSKVISEKTQCSISVSTIKRVYQIVKTNHITSKYVLNVLAKYCDYQSWLVFIAKKKKIEESNGHQYTWTKISQQASQLTSAILQHNKLTSGIPYPLTIPRKTLHTHINNFLKTQATLCLISAPCGAGKTIALNHWITAALIAQERKETDNIYLLLDRSTLDAVALEGYHYQQWLTAVLQLTDQQCLHHFLSQQKPRGNFFIIIDGFNNAIKSHHIFGGLFNQLMELINHLAAYSWIKVILSIRPITWQQYGHLINDSPTLSKQWFTGFTDDKTAINLPYFSLEEIQHLSEDLAISPEAAADSHVPFNHPMHLQSYYHLYKQGHLLKKTGLQNELAAVASYLTSYVLKGGLAEDKYVFLCKVIPYIRFEQRMAIIDIKQIIQIIREHSLAYCSLLEDALIQENLQKKGWKTLHEIKFLSPIHASYFLILCWLEENNYLINWPLLQRINTSLCPPPIKAMIMEWLMLFSSSRISNKSFLFPSFLTGHYIEMSA